MGAPKGRIPWNKGLTAKTDIRVKNNTDKLNEAVRKQYENGKKNWKFGLRKEIDLRVAKQVETFKKKMKSGEIMAGMLGKHHTEDSKRKSSKSQKGRPQPEYKKALISKTLVNKIASGEVELKLPKSKFYEDLGHYVRSSWEANICRYLRSMDVRYEYEKRRFKLVIDENVKVYIPDLYLPEYNLFIEIKGYEGKNGEKLMKYYLFKKQYPDKNILLINSKCYKYIINSKIFFTEFYKFREFIRSV